MPSDLVIQQPPVGLDAEGLQCWDRQDAVILAYQDVGTLSKAAQVTNLSPNAVYQWTKLNIHDFNTRMERGRQGYRDTLEAMVQERLSNPTGNRGSDVLLMGALNANHPDKWSRNIQVTHEVGREVMATIRKIQEQQETSLPIEGDSEDKPWLTSSTVVEGESEVVEDGVPPPGTP